VTGLTPRDPTYHRQRNRLEVCGITGLDCPYGVDLRVSEAFREDAQKESKYLSENGEPEEVRRYGCWRILATVLS